MKTITLCLLTWNEIRGCVHDVPKIKITEFEDIYAIDAGSTDGTVEYLKNKNITVYKQPQKGLNAAHIFAVSKCKTDAIIFFHPKGTISVSNLLKFRKYFNEDYGLIVASRIIKNSRNEEDDKIFKPRKWLTIFLAITTSIFWKKEGNTVWDILHGFRGLSLSAFKQIKPPNAGLTIDMAGVLQSYKNKIKRIEFPVKERSRISGKTHFKIVPVSIEILKYFIREAIKFN